MERSYKDVEFVATTARGEVQDDEDGDIGLLAAEALLNTAQGECGTCEVQGSLAHSLEPMERAAESPCTPRIAPTFQVGRPVCIGSRRCPSPVCDAGAHTHGDAAGATVVAGRVLPGVKDPSGPEPEAPTIGVGLAALEAAGEVGAPGTDRERT